jgi:co-chaperonin GroES (HSP10)
MKVRPRKNTLLVQPEIPKTTERKVGSIVLPETHWSMHPDIKYAVIVEVGDMCEDLRVGMKVIIGKMAGVQLTPQDDSMILLAEEDVIAEVIEHEPHLSTMSGRREIE